MSVVNSFLKQQNLDVSIYPITDIKYPIIGILIYILIDYIYSPSESRQKIPRQTGRIFKIFVVLHNIGLALFSMICFSKIFPLVYTNIITGSMDTWENTICNLFSKQLIGMNQTYGFWAWAFYISKYYEFFDTWILLYKGRKPIFLQIFHHIGAVFICWLCVINKLPNYWIFITFNSFIHSIMYVYYAASTLKIRIPFKFIITILQILQFIVGLTVSVIEIYSFYSKKNCFEKNNIVTATILQTYVGILVVMFSKFYKKTYKSDKKIVNLKNKKID